MTAVDIPYTEILSLEEGSNHILPTLVPLLCALRWPLMLGQEICYSTLVSTHCKIKVAGTSNHGPNFLTKFAELPRKPGSGVDVPLFPDMEL